MIHVNSHPDIFFEETLHHSPQHVICVLVVAIRNTPSFGQVYSSAADLMLWAFTGRPRAIATMFLPAGVMDLMCLPLHSRKKSLNLIHLLTSEPVY